MHTKNDRCSQYKQIDKAVGIEQEATMNLTHLGRNKMGLRERFRRHRPGRRFRHDPWLVLNMDTFNFEGDWNRTFNSLRTSESGHR